MFKLHQFNEETQSITSSPNKKTKQMIYKGTMKDFREFFLKKWCTDRGIDPIKWNYAAPSLMNDVIATDPITSESYKMWAGSSGCNFMMVGKTGGCHNFLELDKTEYEFSL